MCLRCINKQKEWTEQRLLETVDVINKTGSFVQFLIMNARGFIALSVILYMCKEATMIFSPTSKDVGGYSNRYAAAAYNMAGGGNPPRNGLVQKQYYIGQILDGGRFHVLKPDRMCNIAEFLSFELVSKRWSELSETERSLLFAIYSQKKLALDSLSTEVPAATWNEAACRLNRAGYIRWTDEIQVVELTLIGEAEIQHHIFNLSAGDNVVGTNGGIRVQHHGVQDHEIDLGQSSSLTINVDGMLIRIFTLPGSGAVVRIDLDAAQQVYMSRLEQDKNFAQIYIDRAAAVTSNHPSVNSGESTMKNKPIYITSLDMQRLKHLLDSPDLMQQKPYLQELEREINRAVIVQSTEVSADTVTMNSTARLVDLKTDEEMIFTLVYPDHANIAEGRISVLAPIGTAILGCSEGEMVEWEVPDGMRSLKVDRILYQPEAAGEYAL
jgi:regulator of nucleoside diphosphate kinase